MNLRFLGGNCLWQSQSRTRGTILRQLRIAWDEWQQLSPTAKIAESELRSVIAKQIESAAASDALEDADANLSTGFARWTETMQALQVKNNRIALVSQIVTEVQHLK